MGERGNGPEHRTLKLLSKEFHVSINTLLGSPHPLVCQCCGMSMGDELLGRNRDGSLNEDYCQWCYADGTYTFSDMDDLIRVCVPNLVQQGFTEEQAREHLKQTLSTLDYWKQQTQLGDGGQFEALKRQLIEEINALHIPGLPKVEKLNALVGAYVNLEYPLPGGMKAKFLDDRTTYLGNQLESELPSDR